jgi:eukaryotic-like serine/threonine-protein kinase
MFDGNSRFKLIRQLGAGGMGVVYEALDQQRNTRVALKTLRETNADLLYRLKREFRGLRDLVHRNLASLDELFEQDGRWFFTMELLDGEDLRTYFQRSARVEGADTDTAAAAAAATIASMAPADAFEATLPRAVAEEAVVLHQAPAVEFDRVREVFGQITEGLLAIHEAGKIHRDIKPSNVIVTRDGRAVILDFGLVTEQWGVGQSGEGEIVGTLLYMAPEQAAAQAVGPAADWFSVGVMLYEVITGQRPFAGPWGVLAAKQQAERRDPRALNGSCPDDLAELCLRLLEIDPLRRPPGPEVRSRFGAVARSEPAEASRTSSAPQQRVFVGREAELRELRRAFEDVNHGAAITLFVHGESGIGKSTLIHRFVSAIEGEHGGAVILAGQCREHEAVPFKAMDGIIDALSHHVCRLSEVAAAELVPQNAALLPSVFPVLGRIPALAKAPRPLHAAENPFQQRKRVFTALRDMLCLLTERSRLICVIDDMQWADSDSLHLLSELLQPPDQPRLLLLASVRSGEESPPLPQLPGEVRRIGLRPLEPEESVRLAGMLLERLAPEQKTQTARIVDETGGHPLFIGELVRHAAADPGAAIKQLRLDEAIWARVSQLDVMSASVLEVLAMAVAPLPEEVIRVAATLDASRMQKSVALLRATHLVRSASSTQAVLEVYHDRVRQAVVHHLDEAERIALNGRIAEALERSGAQLPPELLIHHLQGARQLGAAARKALEAADRAHAGLAFERASQLYEIALGGTVWSEAERREILIKRGAALSSAGRGPDAARAYAEAAEGADPSTQLSCRTQVVDQFLQSGYLEQGAELLLSLFRECGHAVPRSQLRLMLRILWYRMRLARRGRRWTERGKSEIAPGDQALLALYRAATRGISMIDPVRATYFACRGRLLAMNIGDRDHVTYFALLERGLLAAEGTNKSAAFSKEIDELVKRHPDPLYQIHGRVVLAIIAYLKIDRGFQEAFEVLAQTDDAMAQAANTAWELSSGRYFLVCSLHKMGDFARLRAYSRRFLREAEQRGNIYARTTINRRANILWLVDDDPDGARESLKTDSWVSYAQGYHVQHWLELNARVDIAIYEGSTVDREFLSGQLRGLEKSSLQRFLDYRCETTWMLGRLGLSERDRGPSQRRVVRRSIAKLLSYKTHYARMLATMLRATLALQDGELERAAGDLREVVAMGDAAHFPYLAAAARRRLGALVAGDAGRELVAVADRWMHEAGIKDAERMTHLVSPHTSI